MLIIFNTVYVIWRREWIAASLFSYKRKRVQKTVCDYAGFFFSVSHSLNTTALFNLLNAYVSQVKYNLS